MYRVRRSVLAFCVLAAAPPVDAQPPAQQPPAQAPPGQPAPAPTPGQPAPAPAPPPATAPPPAPAPAPAPTPPPPAATYAPGQEPTGPSPIGEHAPTGYLTPQPLSPGPTEEQNEPGQRLEIYGFVMLDSGYDFGKVGNPDWFDTMRPTKLDSFPNEFGTGSRTFAGVRQTRFGVDYKVPTAWAPGELHTKFEWELFGVGVDEGQTTLRLRHAYGDWGQFRAGQTWSPFMDIDVFPNSIEYWGPNGMVFFRNVQAAWMPIRGESRVTVAAERPGASADTEPISNLIDLTGIIPRFPAPDISAEGRYAGGWGYVELAAIMRYINWDDISNSPTKLAGHVWGWGVNVSSNIKLNPVILKLQAVYGQGIENYMNDATFDVVPKANNSVITPFVGEALPVLGLVAFADIDWSKEFTSSVGWSFVWINNGDLEVPSAFHIGHYALANLLWHPTDKIMLGGEFQFGRRENKSDGFDVNDYKLQFSAKYVFSQIWGGKR